MPGRGGRREGAGRPRGAKTVRRTAAIRERERRSKEILPLEVMLEAMRDAHKGGNYAAAAAYAKDAAPYMHAKLASVQHSGPNNGPIDINLAGLSDAQLAQLEPLIAALAGAAGGAAAGDPGGEGEAGD
jgi:hypothetical protein